MITTDNARIEVRDSSHLSAWADVGRICSGLVVVVKFTPSWGGAFFLAKRTEDPKTMALIIAPSDKWAGDILDSGWTIVHKIEDQPEETVVPSDSAAKCPKCDGTGWMINGVQERSSMRPCPKCHGSGFAPSPTPEGSKP